MLISKGMTRLFLVMFLVGMGIGFLVVKKPEKEIEGSIKTSLPTATNVPTIRPKIPEVSNTSLPPTKIVFGVGDQAGPALDYKLVKEAPIRMLSSWYNGHKDLEWIRLQKNDLYPKLYKNEYIVHLITWTDFPEEQIQTKYGSACGRPYPVSIQILTDMKELAQIHAGAGQLYVTLFTEFPTYTCTDNIWTGNENYWKALKDNYRAIKNIFHKYAPRSKVAISWGGWLSKYDDPENSGGRSLFPKFSDIMNESDFTAFQAMESDSNVEEILDMTKILSTYKKPIMLAHYKPENNSQAVFDADTKSLFTDEVMKTLVSEGLFAMSFMDYNQIGNNEVSYQIVKNAVFKYSR